MKGTWDLETQEFHGGQSWRECDNFVSDFSVTTTPFDPPTRALEAARDALLHIKHYPNADATEARTYLAKFCKWSSSRMLVGNGASEFIDMLMKVLPDGPFAPAPYIATYQEYHRAARAANREIINFSSHESDITRSSSSIISKATNSGATVMVFIRPNSPTGECISLDDLEKILIGAPNMNIIVDESFLAFAGPQWNDLSAVQLIDRFPERLVVLQSWTKLWSCAGLRLGSLCASDEWIKTLKKIQTPWSCNSISQAFAVEAVKDTKYLHDTWENVKEWRKSTVDQVNRLGWIVVQKSDYPTSCEWTPWVLVKCPSKQVAAKASKFANSVGCPIRLCASYGLADYIRIAVRQPEHQVLLFSEWNKRFPSCLPIIK